MSGYTDKTSSVRMKYYDLADVLGEVDFTGAKQDAARIRYNFNLSGGMLVRGLGVEEAGLFDTKSMRSVHYFRRYDASAGQNTSLIVGVTADGALVYCYEENTGVTYTVADVTIYGYPSFINYNFDGVDYLIINDGEYGMYCFDGQTLSALRNPVVSSIAIYDNMLFGCSLENYACVKYAALSSPSGWSSNMSGIRLFNECGMVQSLATIKSYLYVFQEYGITRISRYDGQTGNYEIHKVWYSGEKLVRDSVAVCGDDVYFCTHSGVYCFNGTTVRRVMTELDGFITPDQWARICFYNGKVNIATKVSLVDEPFEIESTFYHNNAIITYDPASKGFDVYRGICVTAFCPIPVGNTLLVAVDGYRLGSLKSTGQAFDKALYKYFETTASNFGTGNKKLVHSVRIKNDAPVELKLYVDGQTYFYAIPAGQMRHVRLNQRGYRIAISLKALESECNISVPVITYSEEVG